MLMINNRPIFASEERRRLCPLSWLYAVPTIAGLALIAWLAVYGAIKLAVG
jgi:hypothetical protein